MQLRVDPKVITCQVNTMYRLDPLMFIVWQYDAIKLADSWELVPHIAWMQGMKVTFK